VLLNEVRGQGRGRPDVRFVWLGKKSKMMRQLARGLISEQGGGTTTTLATAEWIESSAKSQKRPRISKKAPKSQKKDFKSQK
jgi:hypothetical protein